MNDPYTILGVSQTATDEEISKAYKKLARKYHPDLNPGDKTAEMKMKEINSAYETIKSVRSGKTASNGAYTGGYRTYGNAGGYSDPFGSYRDSRYTGFYGFDFSEMFRQAQQQQQQRNYNSESNNNNNVHYFGFGDIFRSFIRFSLIMTLLRFVFGFFFMPGF